VEALRILDRLEIIALADNSLALWTDIKRDDVQMFYKWGRVPDEDNDSSLVAGAGLSFLIRATIGDETSTILFDTAESASPMKNNVDFLGIDLMEIDSIVLSHGHDDHFGGLIWSLQRIGKQGVPVYVHPNMTIQKGFRIKKEDREEIRKERPFPSNADIEKAGGEIHSFKGSVTLSNGMLLRTGEIPREIEQDKTKQLLLMNGDWIEDPMIVEDVSLVAVVKGKGLVVIVGCSHAGILNIVREAVRLTGESNVHAIIGGFHLAPYEDTHSETIQFLRDMKPQLIVPCHCTGWKARHKMSKELPDAYVEGSVGHKYIIEDVDTT
jgi:7,8-dihydropterin-6-yl-methyl-4-(beta-D-ribofuranosyl)aminobenzene 5'-phosphate synthase